MASDLLPGGVYSIESGAGRYGVAKVLVIEPGVAHVRVYKNKFDTRPTQIETAKLSLGNVFSGEGFGIGHLPLTIEGFLNWHPVLLLQEPVTQDELRGYEHWKYGGGVWGA